MSSDDRLRTLNLSNLEERRLRGDFSAIYNFLKSGSRERERCWSLTPGSYNLVMIEHEGITQSCTRKFQTIYHDYLFVCLFVYDNGDQTLEQGS